MINLQAMRRRKNVDRERIKHWISIAKCLILTIVFVLIASFVELLYKETGTISIVSLAFHKSVKVSVERDPRRSPTINHKKESCYGDGDSRFADLRNQFLEQLYS